MREYYVYIMTSRSGVLYTGVTNDLMRRVQEHKEKTIRGFTSRYNIDRRVYYESTDNIESAIIWEKLIQRLEPKEEDCTHRVNESELE